MFFIILLAIFAVFCVVKYQSLFKGYDKIDATFPGPKSWPLLGNTLMLLGDSTHIYKTAFRLGANFKRYFRIWFGPIPYIVLLNPEDIEVTLNNMDLLKKTDEYDSLIPWIGLGLVSSFGERWKKHRKLLTPVFHFKILEGYSDIFQKNGDILLKTLEKEIGNKSFDIMPYYDLWALDNICETAMGVSINAQVNREPGYSEAVDKMRNVIFLRVFLPFFRIGWIFNISPFKRIQTKALEIIHGIAKKVVDERIKNRKLAAQNAVVGNNEMDDNDLGIKTKRVFLDLLLDLVDNGDLSVDDVLQEVNTFILGGHDTITTAVSFASYSIANHPQYQELAYLEQRRIFGDDQRTATRQDLLEMKYLEMIIKETLRLYPSIPAYGRYALTDVKLKDSTVIPKGCNIVMPIMVTHRKADIWEKPNDFFPDHFLPEACVKRHPFAFLPFGAGPRNCIGQKFAMMEMKSTLSQILRRFKLIPASPQVELELYTKLLIGSASGIHIAILPRKEN